VLFAFDLIEERKEEQKKFDAWAATIPKADYAGMCAALERERLELEAGKISKILEFEMIAECGR
jgi:hypothetical protein